MHNVLNYCFKIRYNQTSDVFVYNTIFESSFLLLFNTDKTDSISDITIEKKTSDTLLYKTIKYLYLFIFIAEVKIYLGASQQYQIQLRIFSVLLKNSLQNCSAEKSPHAMHQKQLNAHIYYLH